MPKINDQDYLRNEQYKTSANLEARIRLHRQFSTNPYPWFRWVYDQVDPHAGERMLEAGCGPGGLWQDNLDRLPEGVELILGDLSHGMIQKARRNLNDRFQKAVFDVQDLPFREQAFDRVVANHMLYHVPDIPQAVKELRRLLKPGGRLCTTTNGLKHLLDLHQLIQDFNPKYGLPTLEQRRYTLENAAALLRAEFDVVEVRVYQDDLKVTEIQPLLDYILSMTFMFQDFTHSQINELKNFLQTRLELRGFILIRKSQGVLIAQ
jgi:ubiquinone/menaquinone biosynthesis C-methylase UbiE